MAQHTADLVILEKLENLKEIFDFEGKIVPFMEELFIFLKDVLPLLERVSQSLHETTTNMPKAQQRITQANNAAEAATQEIMDKLDIINLDLSQLTRKMKNHHTSDEINSLISSVQDNSLDIVCALQFQDITAQQLTHAQQILQAIYKRFNTLFTAIRTLDVDENFKKMFFGKFADEIDQAEGKNIHRISEDHIRNRGISQKDIDKLFQHNR